MPKLVFLDSAVEDLTTIFSYIAQQSSSRVVGRTWVDQLVQYCQKVATLQGVLGQARPELRHDIRSLPFRNYVIFFRYVDDRLEIASILERHRDSESHFASKLGPITGDER